MKRLILSASRLVVVACLLLLALGSNAFGDILVPAGLNPGDKYHLAFVSSTSRDATSSDIGVYNSFVQAAADAAGIGASEGVVWKAIASTTTPVRARDNALVSAPVYRMDGQQLATGFSDLWDGSPLTASLSLDENGQSVTSIVFTGTNPNGTLASHPLGLLTPTGINTGFTSPVVLASTWIKNGQHHPFNNSFPLYALSSELTVPEGEDNDGDGVPDDVDNCPNSDLGESIMIDDCDTEVANMLLDDDGCTMTDRIAECAEGVTTHREFVSCVPQLANDWKRDGLISGREKGRIHRCASSSGRGR